MKVFCPSDNIETKCIIEVISKIDGPCYVRLCRLATPVIYDENQKFEIGKMVQFGDGTDGTIFATGVAVSEALKAQEILIKKGKDVRVIDVHTIKPIDTEMIIKCAKETEKLVSVEDHNVIGGLGSAISEVLTANYPKKLERLGINDTFGVSGNAKELLHYFKIDCDAIVNEFLL